MPNVYSLVTGTTFARLMSHQLAYISYPAAGTTKPSSGASASGSQSWYWVVPKVAYGVCLPLMRRPSSPALRIQRYEYTTFPLPRAAKYNRDQPYLPPTSCERYAECPRVTAAGPTLRAHTMMALYVCGSSMGSLLVSFMVTRPSSTALRPCRLGS